VRAHITWDATTLYVAYEQPAITGGTVDQRLVLYTGTGAPGTLTGLNIGGQQPSLAFQATRAIQWSADGSVGSLYRFNGAAWLETANWLGTAGSAVVENDPAGMVELAIPLAALDVSTQLDLHLAWVDDRLGLDRTEGGVPATSFADGADPNYARYYRFELATSTVPSSYTPLP
jgi:hypothetical protein